MLVIRGNESRGQQPTECKYKLSKIECTVLFSHRGMHIDTVYIQLS